MTRTEAERIVWRETHKDYKGTLADGTKTIMVLRAGGSCLVSLDGLTDTEILARLPAKAKKRTYSEEAQALMGANFARILQMRRDSEHRDRFQTTWGTKTALGVFATITRFADEVQAGPADMCDDLRYEGGRKE